MKLTTKKNIVINAIKPNKELDPFGIEPLYPSHQFNYTRIRQGDTLDFAKELKHSDSVAAAKVSAERTGLERWIFF